MLFIIPPSSVGLDSHTKDSESPDSGWFFRSNQEAEPAELHHQSSIDGQTSNIVTMNAVLLATPNPTCSSVLFPHCLFFFRAPLLLLPHLPLFFTLFCNKSDKIRNCISFQFRLEEGVMFRRGIPDMAHQAFVTFQWFLVSYPLHPVRHPPVVDRLRIRQVEEQSRLLGRLLLSVLAAISCLEHIGTEISSAWMNPHQAAANVDS